MMKEKIKEIEKKIIQLRADKTIAVIDQKYEEASNIRLTERELLMDLYRLKPDHKFVAKDGFIKKFKDSQLTKDAIKEQVHQLMIDGIYAVISGKEGHADLLYSRPADIIAYIQELGGKAEDDFDTNGYGWDYWFKVTLNGETYQVAGDGYHQASATFSK